MGEHLNYVLWFVYYLAFYSSGERAHLLKRALHYYGTIMFFCKGQIIIITIYLHNVLAHLLLPIFPS